MADTLNKTEVAPRTLALFKARATKAGASVIEAANLTEAAQAIARHLAEMGGGAVVATVDLLNQPAFKTELTSQLRPASDVAAITGATIGVSPATFGVAETGSVVYAVNHRLERLVAMLSTVHFAILYQHDLLANLEEAGRRVSQLQLHEGRRYISFVTGPSRTADIERVLTIGVQGPQELYIVLIGQLSMGEEA